MVATDVNRPTVEPVVRRDRPPEAPTMGTPDRRRAPVAAGVLSILGGAWVAVIAYAGPSIGFSMGSTRSWQWTLDRAVLHLLPGVIAVVCGAVLLRRHAIWAAGAALVAGGWALLGPDAWPVMHHAAGMTHAATGGMSGMSHAATGADLSRTIAYHRGPGMVILVAGGWAIGHILRRCPD